MTGTRTVAAAAVLSLLTLPVSAQQPQTPLRVDGRQHVLVAAGDRLSSFALY